MTLSRLNDMIQLFMGKPFTKYVPSRTYIFVPSCPKLRTYGHVYVSEKPLHAEDEMEANCGLPTEFYLTSAPCPNCAKMLMEKYNKKKKPIIHIARPYIGKGKTEKGNKKVNTECLAMLVQDGFQLTPWDWEPDGDFYSYINERECKTAIGKMLNTNWKSTYNKKYANTEITLDKVEKMASKAKNGYYKTQCFNSLKG